jgi:hypothetical protein
MSSSLGSLTLSLASNAAQVFQGQSSTTVNATLLRSGATGGVTLNVAGLPPGATDQIQSTGNGNSGSVAFNAGTAAGETYPMTVTASDGTLSSTANLTLNWCSVPDADTSKLIHNTCTPMRSEKVDSESC